MTDLESNAGYAQEAADLLVRYESFPSEDVHARWRDFFPTAPGRALDIGAGFRDVERRVDAPRA